MAVHSGIRNRTWGSGAVPPPSLRDIPKVEVEEVDYEDMSLAALTSLAEVRGLAKYGTKAEIAERLRENDAATVEEN